MVLVPVQHKRRRRHRIGRHLLTGCLALLTAAPAAPAQDLPLGPPSLDERRVSTDVAPGVSHQAIVRGSARTRPGPWRIHVLRVAPGVPLGTALSNGSVFGTQPLSGFVRRGAAVNGAYFVTTGIGAGDVVGVHIDRGRVDSEPVDGRSALVLPADPLARPRIAALSFDGRVKVGGRSRMLDGVNRVRGVVWGCGGRGGDQPTERQVHGIYCTDTSELIQLMPSFGARTPAVPGGIERVVRDGVVSGSARAGGGTPIPRDGYVLSGSGDAARFLRRADGAVDLTTAIRTSRGTPLRLTDVAGAVSGGPRLLDGGRIAVRSRAEGFARPGLYGRFVLGPNPRTLAGVTASGELLLVTIDGRRPRFSAGVSLRDAARVMRALGARDALNLDGGGSTTMVVGGRVVNRPSDPGGERAIGSGVLVGR